MVINGMHGLGDNIFQRAFIKNLKGRVWLSTPWPEIYKDLPKVRFLNPGTRLRTQRKNVDRQSPLTWANHPDWRSKRIHYGGACLANGSIVDAMTKCFGVEPAEFDLPLFDGPKINGEYAVIRPSTVRNEWKNTARNPDHKYLAEAARIMIKAGLKVVSVADIEDGHEWAEGIPPHDIAYHHGELNIEELFGLIRGASVVVGGVGWIVPACISSKTPLITVLGGHGGHNAPEKITSPKMDLSRVQWIYPDNYCRCSKMLHHCNKTITGFSKKFEDALCRIF